MAIADVYEDTFGYQRWVSGPGKAGGSYRYTVNQTGLYDFLYDRGYEAWFCNAARSINYTGYETEYRAVKDFIMKLHTGETIAAPEWTWEQREKLGQRYLQDLAENILNQYAKFIDAPDHLLSDSGVHETAKKIRTLLSSLQLDGYEYKGGRLLAPEIDVLDAEEATGVLQSLYAQLSLPNKDKNFEFLKLSEEYYIAERWADSIHNSRKFLEGTLQEVAAAHSLRVKVPLHPSSLPTNHEPVRPSDDDQEQYQGQGKLNILRGQRVSGEQGQEERNGQDEKGNGPRYYHCPKHDGSEYSSPRLRPAAVPMGRAREETPRFSPYISTPSRFSSPPASSFV